MPMTSKRLPWYGLFEELCDHLLNTDPDQKAAIYNQLKSCVYLNPNENDIQRQIQGLMKKFRFHNQKDRSDALETLAATCASEMVLLLIELSHSPTSVFEWKPNPRSRVEDDPATDFEDDELEEEKTIESNIESHEQRNLSSLENILLQERQRDIQEQAGEWNSDNENEDFDTEECNLEEGENEENQTENAMIPEQQKQKQDQIVILETCRNVTGGMDLSTMHYGTNDASIPEYEIILQMLQRGQWSPAIQTKKQSIISQPWCVQSAYDQYLEETIGQWFYPIHPKGMLESQVIQCIFHLLSGVESSLFCKVIQSETSLALMAGVPEFQQRTETPITLYHVLPETLKCVFKTFIDYANDLAWLRYFITLVKSNTFHSSLQWMSQSLQGYAAGVEEMIMELMNQMSNVQQKMLTKGSMTSILSIRMRLSPMLEQFHQIKSATLQIFQQDIPACGGNDFNAAQNSAVLLHGIYAQMIHYQVVQPHPIGRISSVGCSITIPDVWNSLFQWTYGPYFALVKEWMNGNDNHLKIDDPFQEFYITTATTTASSLKHSSKEIQFLLRLLGQMKSTRSLQFDLNIPSFLQSSAEQIWIIGISNRICIESKLQLITWTDDDEMSQHLNQDKKEKNDAALSMATAVVGEIDQGTQNQIHKLHLETGSVVARALLYQWKIINHFQVLRLILFSGEPDRLSYFRQKLDSKQNSNTDASLHNTWLLQNLLQYSFRQRSSCSWKQSNPALESCLDYFSIRVNIVPDDRPRHNRNRNPIWDVLEFIYDPPWPISAILTPEHLVQYNLISRFIFFVASVERHIVQLKQDMVYLENPDDQVIGNQVALQLSIMLQFAQTLKDYLLNQCLYASWNWFEPELNQAQNAFHVSMDTAPEKNIDLTDSCHCVDPSSS